MEDFLKKFSSIPHKFITDFYVIAKETYDENQIIIDFDLIAKWLNVQKNHLKEVLIKNFEERFDYTSEKKQKEQINSTGRTTYYEILITPNCFKELCMISQTSKAKEVRKYFIAMEQLIKRYHDNIEENMRKEIGLLKINQKPKTKIKGGVLYILRALNTDDILYKIGKTKGLSGRLATYNSGNANDMEPEFIIPVKDITVAENCIKATLRNFRYRKYKDVFEIDLQQLKELFEKCVDLANQMQKYYENKITKKIQRAKQTEDNNKYIIFIVKDDDDTEKCIIKSKYDKIKHKKIQQGGFDTDKNNNDENEQKYVDNKKLYKILIKNRSNQMYEFINESDDEKTIKQRFNESN